MSTERITRATTGSGGQAGRPLTFGELFAGIGGIGLGLERAGLECLFQVENEPFCLKVLAKHWPTVRRFTDVRECTGAELGYVDVLAGGFPCQDLSQAGKRAGLDGDRSGLWFEFARLIGEIRPRYVVAENVSGILTMPGAMGVLTGELARLGYVGLNVCLRASDFGASHLRKRVFIVAHAEHAGPSPAGSTCGLSAAANESTGCREDVAHSTPGRRGERREPSGGDGFTDGSHAELDDAHGDGTQRPRGAEQGANSGREELDDASRDARHGSHGQDGPRRGVCGPSDPMAYAGCAREGRTEESAGQYWGGSSDDDRRTSGALADTGNGQLQEPGRGSQGRNRTGSAGAILPDASAAGLPDAEQEELSGSRRGDEGRTITELCGPFAPGPNDTRWPAILGERPDLAPAIDIEEAAQSQICSLAPWLPAELVRAMTDRTKKLKAYGNSVVPACAEYVGRRILAHHTDTQEEA